MTCQSKLNRPKKFNGAYWLIASLALVPLSAFADRPLSKKHSSFYDYFTSVDFDCSVPAKRIFKPGTISDDHDSTKAIPACLLTVTCNPVAGVRAKPVTAAPTCLAHNGVCEEPLECARRKTAFKGIGGRVLEVAAGSTSANNKFNDFCWETAGIKGKRGTIQILDSGVVLEEACVAIYTCKHRKEAGTAVCAVKSEQALVGGKAVSKSVCPQLNDCINEDVSLPGYTERELQKMSAVERDRVMKQYEAGIEQLTSTVSQVSSTLPRQSQSVFNQAGQAHR